VTPETVGEGGAPRRRDADARDFRFQGKGEVQMRRGPLDAGLDALDRPGGRVGMRD